MSAFAENLLQKYKGKLPQDYIIAIIGLKENNTDRRFMNDSDVHAALLIECMIGDAAEADGVRIYSGSLKAECYKDVLNQSKSCNIKALVDDLPAAQRVIDSLDEQRKSCIKLLAVVEKDDHHFYTVGDKHFRYEMDHGVATAIANFNEPTTVSKLNSRFDRMWQNAESKSPRL